MLALIMVPSLASASKFPSYIEFECDNFTYWGNARKDIEVSWVKTGWDVENTEAEEMTTIYYRLPDGNVLLNVNGQEDWQSFISSSPVMLLNCKIKKEKSNW